MLMQVSEGADLLAIEPARGHEDAPPAEQSIPRGITAPSTVGSLLARRSTAPDRVGGLQDRRRQAGAAHGVRRGKRNAPSRRTVIVGGLAVVVAATMARLATENTQRVAHVALIVLAGSSVAIADSLIKKAAHEDDFWIALRSPVTLLAIALYLVQIVLFTYVFAKKWNLGVVGLMQMVIYAAIVVFVGITFFQEKISRTQGAGMALALVGAVLMNL